MRETRVVSDKQGSLSDQTGDGQQVMVFKYQRLRAAVVKELAYTHGVSRTTNQYHWCVGLNPVHDRRQNLHSDTFVDAPTARMQQHE
jgi:hypothetical protein